MKILMKIVAFFSALMPQNQVVAFFSEPSGGATAPYKEGDFVGEGSVAADRNDVTKGKQIIISVGGGKAQILAFDTDGITPAATRNPHWFAPSRAWLDTATVPTSDIDFDNSDLVYGTGQTVTLGTIDNTKIIPFKRVGTAIKYDAQVGGSTTPTSVSGLSTSNAPAPAPGQTPVPAPGATPGGNTNTPVTGNAKTGLAAIAWYIWVLIAVGFVALFYLGKSLVKGKGKKVSK